jgi:hypothetical protein
MKEMGTDKRGLLMGEIEEQKKLCHKDNNDNNVEDND